LGYRFTIKFFDERNETTVFAGADIYCGQSTAIDSDNAVKAVMGFLTLRKGDVSADYFDHYNDVQKDFRDTYAESLAYSVYVRFGE
jgi:hypothetical protein